jgi:hypothetical protein
MLYKLLWDQSSNRRHHSWIRTSGQTGWTKEMMIECWRGTNMCLVWQSGNTEGASYVTEIWEQE